MLTVITPSRYSGAERMAVYLAEALGERGHRVVFACKRNELLLDELAAVTRDLIRGDRAFREAIIKSIDVDQTRVADVAAAAGISEVAARKIVKVAAIRAAD